MRVLVVEDQKEISTFLKSNFERAYFAVDVAEDGEKGSFLARTNDYDLVILDYMLPKKLGKDVCQEIRKKKKEVPIIVISVKSEIPTKVALLDIGADDYLTKPFAFEELLARVRAIFRRPRRRLHDLTRLGDLLINFKKHSVHRGQQDIYLTRKEFMIFELLVKRKGEIVSRGTIMEHVWDINADPFSNTIETHIRRLRTKLTLPDEKEFIRTVPGRGYTID